MDNNTKATGKFNMTIKIVIMIIISCISIFADYKLKISCTMFNGLVSILFSTVAVIAGIWISCYLLFFQLYKDRYPIKIVKEKYLPNMRNSFLKVVYTLVFGCVLIVINNGIVANVCFTTVSLITIIEILLKIYQTNKSLMINTYIDEFCEKLQKDLNCCNNVICEQNLKDIKYILDESIVKEEYYVTQNITEKMGAVYRAFLDNSIKMLGTGSTAKDIEVSFDKIVGINIYQLELCSKINSELLVKKIIRQQRKNLEFCIDASQYEWFKEYFHEYNVFVFQMQKDRKADLVDELYYLYIALFKMLIDKNKEEWIKYGLLELMQITSSLIFAYKNINVCNYANFLSGMLIYCTDKDKQSIYQIVNENIEKLTVLVCKTAGTFYDIRVYYVWIFNELLKKDNQKAKDFFELVSKNSITASEDPILIEFKLYCIDELNDKCVDNESQDNLFEQHIEIIINMIALNTEYNSYIILPNFESKIYECNNVTSKIDNIIDAIVRLLNECIIKDNVQMFFHIISKVNLILAKTETRHRIIQEKLFDIYIWLVKRTKNLINKQFFEISFDQISDAIKNMDKARSISASFGKHIIESLSSCAKNGNSDDFTIMLNVVNLFMTFLSEGRELLFISSSADRKKELYRGMFNIGTCCIENNFEEGLRRVSNAIGWFTIYSIDQTTGELTTYLIERAGELYNISKSMDVSSKTQTFILTLFTTVGAYCCKDIHLNSYLSKILNCIKNEDEEKVKTAVSLRTSENDMWNELYNDRTKDLTNQFMTKFIQLKRTSPKSTAQYVAGQIN